MNRSLWRLEEVDGSPWRLEEVDGGDEQYPVESRFAVRHTPPPRFNCSAPTQVRFVHFAVHHTPPDQQDPRFDCRRSVSSVLRYATPLPINRTPVSTVGVPFPPFCCMPDPSRSIGPCSERRRSMSSVVRYAGPRFHCLFCPSPPDEHDHAFRSNPAGWLPMNTMTTLFLLSDRAMYVCASRR